MNIKKRYDCFLIWPHAIDRLEQIIHDIHEDENFSIKVIKRYKVKNFNRFVKNIYSFDYAPWHHLKNKTKYLRNSGTEVCFIFVENKKPSIEFVDEGKFRHSECLEVKLLKNKIRENYNQRDAHGNLSHNHVIHATDNESQTYDMLKIAGLPIESLNYFNAMNIPWFLSKYRNYKIKLVATNTLYCRQNTHSNNIIVPISESVQYKSLKDTHIDKMYGDYIKSHIGYGLQLYYSIEKYSNLREKIKYLSDGYQNNYVIIRKENEKNIVVDGLHRASILIKDKQLKNMVVCELYD